MEKFFINVETVYKKFEKINDSMISNSDETAISTVHNPPNIRDQKSLKQVGQVTSGEHFVLVTACCFVNASGNSILPFMIFPCHNFKSHMLFGATSGTGGGASKSA